MAKEYKKKSKTELEVTDTIIDIEVISLKNLNAKKASLESNKASVALNLQREADRLDALIAIVDEMIQQAIALGIVEE